VIKEVQLKCTPSVFLTIFCNKNTDGSKKRLFLPKNKTMKLIEIKYSQTNWISTNDWLLSDLSLNDFNLIIGENAVGKSRTVLLISSFAKMLSEQVSNVYNGKFSLKFLKENGDYFIYELDAYKGVKSEKLTVNDKIILNRHENQTEIYSSTTKKVIKISPPDDKLAIHVRRDKDEFPFFEDLIQWAKQVHGFKFGNITPHTLLIDKQADRLTSVDEIPSLLEELKPIEYEEIIRQFNSLGYDLEKIVVRKDETTTKIAVFQKGLKFGLRQEQLSQGMFRSLCLIIFMHYLLSKDKVSTIIVDDFCEGLDYNRAIKLGKLIVEKFANSNIQFIATTNDNFLMNVIDIKYWNILVREGSTVRSFNYQNSKNIFDDFKMSGLSNFYLFSSDFLTQKQL
jgi:predicted ATPase